MLLKESKRLNSDLQERCEYLVEDHQSLSLTFKGYKKSQKELIDSYEIEISCLKEDDESHRTKLAKLERSNEDLSQKLTDLESSRPRDPKSAKKPCGSTTPERTYSSNLGGCFISKAEQEKTKRRMTELEEILNGKHVQ
jgi:ParB-like chromosome segregation protein Spo0J